MKKKQLDARLLAGTSYGRSQLPRPLLQRALENDLWYEVPKGNFRRERGKGKKGKDGKKGEQGKEPEPKGTGERKDNRTLPGGRKPNPTLSGGEGIEPYELYSIMLVELRELAAKQQCTWFCSFDVTAFSRYDQVIHPPKAPAPHTQSSSSTAPPWRK